MTQPPDPEARLARLLPKADFAVFVRALDATAEVASQIAVTVMVFVIEARVHRRHSDAAHVIVACPYEVVRFQS